MTPFRHIVVADTGPLYAAVDPSDRYHKQARLELDKLASEARGVGIILPIIMEAYTLTLYRLGGSVARRWLGEVLAASIIIPITDDDFDAAVNLVNRYQNQPITLYDALVATIAERHELPVWTYDHHFDIMGSRRWYTR